MDALDGHVVHDVLRPLHELLQEHVVVAFSENGLRAEDFTETLFTFFQTLGNINTVRARALAGLQDAPR